MGDKTKEVNKRNIKNIPQILNEFNKKISPINTVNSSAAYHQDYGFLFFSEKSNLHPFWITHIYHLQKPLLSHAQKEVRSIYQKEYIQRASFIASYKYFLKQYDLFRYTLQPPMCYLHDRTHILWK